MDIKQHKSKVLSMIGAVCLAMPVLFLERTVAAGILCTLGFMLLLCGGGCAGTKSDVIANAVFMWAGYTLRFCGLFGEEFIYTLYCALIFVPYCVLMAMSLWLERLLRRAEHPIFSILSILVMPTVYALISYVLAVLNIGYITNLMGYAMCIPVIGVNLSWFGEYGLTFILMLIFLCFSSIPSESKKRTRLVYGAVGGLLSAFLLMNGAALQNRYKEPDYTLRVALATSQEMDFIGENGVFYTEDQQIALFTEAVKEASESGASLLMLNEEYFLWNEENAPELLEDISGIVLQYRMPTLIGVDITTQEGPDINEAVYFDENGEILYTYVKNNLVPFIEVGSYEDGVEEPALLSVTLDGHSVELAYIICYDINDDMYLRKIPASVELLLVPSWDWDTENIEQTRTAARSASLGVTLIKHSFDGFSTVSCPNGKVTEQIDLRGCYETVTTVSVPIWERPY